MQDGPYNDVLPWNYSLVPEVVGMGKGFVVETEEQLERALLAAQKTDRQLLVAPRAPRSARSFPSDGAPGGTISEKYSGRWRPASAKLDIKDRR